MPFIIENLIARGYCESKSDRTSPISLVKLFTYIRVLSVAVNDSLKAMLDEWSE